MHDLFKDFQTLLVGLLGFAGVIFTLWQNAKAARRWRDEEWDHEREVLRTALLEELRINRDALEENAKRLEKPPPNAEDGAVIPTDLMNDAYRSFVSEIGLLSQNEVSKVMGAYLSLQTYNAKLFLVGVPTETSPRHVHVPAEHLKMLAAMMEEVIKPIDAAINSLQDGAGKVRASIMVGGYTER